jgi:hypothetical protein
MTDKIDRAEVLKLFRNKHPLVLYNAIAALPTAPDAVEAKPVSWRQENPCHPGWYIYGDIATQPYAVGAQLLYAKPQAPAQADYDARIKAYNRFMAVMTLFMVGGTVAALVTMAYLVASR